MNKIEQIQKELSKEGYLIKTASELMKEEKMRVDVFALDYVLDGGISMCEGGHRLEFFGAESTGKTTYALHIAKKFQKEGKIVAFVDAEKSYDKDWGEIIGIDNKNLLILYPNTLEEAGDIFTKIIPQVDLIIIDSLVSLIPEGEMERDTAESQMALSARVNSLITRKIYHAIGDRATTMIFINQQREKVGKMFGSPYTTAGGHAVRHMYNTRIEFKIGKAIKDGNDKVGVTTMIQCVKNKRGRPYRVSELDFYLNGHIDNNKSLFYAGLKYSVVERKGNTYSFKDKKEVGEEKFRTSLTPEEWNEISEEVWKRLK